MRRARPEALRPRVEHAVLAVRRGSSALYPPPTRAALKRYGPSSLQRVFAATRIYVGEQQPVLQNPPTPDLFYIPGLSPRLISIAACSPGFLNTSSVVLKLGASWSGCCPPRKRNASSAARHWRAKICTGLALSPSWTGHYFYRHGERREDNCAACPNTAAALDAIALIRIRAHGPEVLHSVFTPGTHLLPHRGVTNARR